MDSDRPFEPFYYTVACWQEKTLVMYNIKLPTTKVCQYSHIKADATPVMNKSFEKLLSNNFQVIIFERMAKNYFKMNILYKIY